MKEVGEVEVRRKTVWRAPTGSSSRHIISEHELDMRRRVGRTSSLVGRLKAFVGRFSPSGSSIGPPTRATDRELADYLPDKNTWFV